MERIKQALERANAQRQQEQKNEPAGPRAESARPSRKTHSKNISYTQTRQMNLDDAHLREQRVLTSGTDSGIANSYKILRTQVLQRMREKGWNALAITSIASGEGKTVTAVNLAISIAQEVNHTVLLVDLDLRHPNVHKILGFEPQYGLSDHLAEGIDLQNILVNPNIERLVILPGKRSTRNSSEVLSSPELVQLVEELKSRYPSRIVIFDLPPLLSADDAMAFSPYVDAALVVIEDGKTQKDDLKRAMEYLRTTELLGTVLNKADPRLAKKARY